MPQEKMEDATPRYERYPKNFGERKYVLRLYVTGASPVSTRAIANLRAVCEQSSRGRFQLEVIDIFQRPGLAKGAQVIAAPTLVRLLPVPMRKLVGNLSQLNGTRFGLDIRLRPEDP